MKETLFFNGVEYEYVDIVFPVYSKKDIALVKMAYNKGIRLLYGVSEYPVVITYLKSDVKINPKLLEKLKTIPFNLYKFATERCNPNKLQ